MVSFRFVCRGSGLACGLLMLAASGAAQVTEHTPGWFRFVMPPLDSTASFTNMSFLNAPPAGAAGPVVIREGHFYEGGRRLRLLGTNVTFAAAFPPKKLAPRIAARLAKFGVNIVRFHHMDMFPAPAGIWRRGAYGRALDPRQLDRLDYFIYQLQRHGIYVDLNLHVSYRYPGTADFGPTFVFGKALDNFYPPFIAQQKRYAKMLLTHYNPYTQTTYARDPAVAVIEMNNENSLTNAPQAALLALPQPYRGVLAGRWRAWWKRQYGATPALRTKWGRVMTPAERVDFEEFLSATECQYVQSMRRYLKRHLGVRAPICDTQASYGGALGLVRAGRLDDYVDMHAYFEHPRFLGRMWGPHWRIANRSMVGAPDGAGLAFLAWHRMLGKPFTVSEFDEPAPNVHRAEMFPLLASFAAFQNWDGIYEFDWASRLSAYQQDRINGFFDMCADPAKLVFMPIAALMFREGAVAVGTRPVLATVDTAYAAALVAKDGPWGWVPPRPRYREKCLPFLRPVGWHLAGRPEAARVPPVAVPAVAITSDTGQILWYPADPRGAEYLVNAPAVRAAVGYIAGRPIQLGDVTIRVDRAHRNFAAVAVGALDDKPIAQSGRILLVVVGDVENTNMGWNKTRTSVDSKWGTAPTVAQGVTATIDLPGTIRLQVLDGTGRPVGEVPVTYRAGGTECTVGSQYHTLWYAVTRPVSAPRQR